jgi:hypothetical protein
MRNAKLVAAVASLAVAAGLGAVSLAVGCSSSSSGGTSSGGGIDAGTGDECGKIDSACGQPCDPGNSLGIGKFCNTIHDCEGTQVPTLCATLGVPDEHFCTAMCSPPDAGPDAAFMTSCGENATCQCQGSQCGCYPSTCQ